jgi:hypothetical protein
MIAGIADVLGPERKYYLCDSFAGLPAPKEIDGNAALEWARNVNGPYYYDNCRAAEDEAIQTMKMSAARQYKTIKGWFQDTLPNAKLGPIALLRMDADWYDSTKQILDSLAPSVVPGGIILVDDYYVFQGCARAVNEYAAAQSWMIRQYWRGDVCYVVA